jgi:3-methyladenine DNA glycosylase AlkD
MYRSKLNEIQYFLNQKATQEGKAAFQKFVPTSQKVYGVRLPEINNLVKQYKKEGIDLVIELWEAGSFEERLLSAKLLGKLAKKEPRKTLQLIHQFSSDITDWAVCDTLGTQSIKAIAKEYHQEVFALSEQLILSRNPWQRRLGIVLLEGYTKDKNFHGPISSFLELVKEDKEYYVKKAVEWIKRDLKKT